MDRVCQKICGWKQILSRVCRLYLVSSLKGKGTKLIFFVDAHATHLKYQLSPLLIDLGIILVSLYPNSTMILQSTVAAAFKPLKMHGNSCIGVEAFKSYASTNKRKISLHIKVLNTRQFVSI